MCDYRLRFFLKGGKEGRTVTYVTTFRCNSLTNAVNREANTVNLPCARSHSNASKFDAAFETKRDKERQRDTKTNEERQRVRKREKEGERGGKREKERGRERERERSRETERQRGKEAMR